jgi:hypothetical protein
MAQDSINVSPSAPSPSANINGNSITAGNLMVSQETRLKRRAYGRSQKLIGDLLLLAGKLPAAMERYLDSIESSKSQTDWLWLASAMEGLYTAILLLQELVDNAYEQVSPRLPPPAREWMRNFSIQEVTTKFREIIAHYEKSDAPYMAAECSLSLAEIMIFFKTPVVDVAALLTQALSTCSMIAPRTQLGLYSKGATLFKKLKLPRKQAFFLHKAVQLVIRITPMQTIHVSPETQLTLMEKLAELYGLLSPEPMGWDVLQTIILEQCIKLSEVAGDSSSLTFLIVKCFHRLQGMLSRESMLNVVTLLQRTSKESRKIEANPLRQFSFLKSVEVIRYLVFLCYAIYHDKVTVT